MRPNPAAAPRGLITELRAALDAIPADEPRNYLRQSLQVLVPLLEQLHQRLQALEARMEALESGPRPPGGHSAASAFRRHEAPETSPHRPAAGQRLPVRRERDRGHRDGVGHLRGR